MARWRQKNRFQQNPPKSKCQGHLWQQLPANLQEVYTTGLCHMSSKDHKQLEL